MELLYLYIGNYNNLFLNQGINFSSNYLVSFNDRILSIKKNDTGIAGYYGDNISSITMIYGKNGVGKTTILDILGMDRQDRNQDSNDKKNYFIVYHLVDNYFGIEFSDSYFFDNHLIENIEDFDYNKALYHFNMGLSFEHGEETNIFHYKGNIILKWLRDNGIDERLKFSFITNDLYNNRLSTFQYSEHDYMFTREYYIKDTGLTGYYRMGSLLKSYGKINPGTLKLCIKDFKMSEVIDRSLYYDFDKELCNQLNYSQANEILKKDVYILGETIKEKYINNLYLI